MSAPGEVSGISRRRSWRTRAGLPLVEFSRSAPQDSDSAILALAERTQTGCGLSCRARNGPPFSKVWNFESLLLPVFGILVLKRLSLGTYP